MTIQNQSLDLRVNRARIGVLIAGIEAAPVLDCGQNWTVARIGD
jgi:hypothetical protein